MPVSGTFSTAANGLSQQTKGGSALNAYNEGMKQNAEGVKSYYDTCDAIIASCQKELEKEDLTFEERSFWDVFTLLCSVKKRKK